MTQFLMTIPTMRMKDVSETVREYAHHFQQYGHNVPIIVFDDNRAGRDESYHLGNRNEGEIFYVGPEQKAVFLSKISDRVSCSVDETILKKIFRPSYGGNRNFTIAYTVGDHFMTCDDDMRPHALMNGSNILTNGEMCRGKHLDRKTAPQKVDYDIMTAFQRFLGRRVSEIPPEVRRGEYLRDSMMDLYTNTIENDELGENTLTLVAGSPTQDAVIKHAQTYRSGSGDVDTRNYICDFFEHPELAFINDMSMIYVLGGFAPCVTAQNWRVDSGVSAFDNSRGIIPFLPTRLRFEDYVFRLWIQDSGLASAHVDAAQTHYRNPYMRESLPSDLHNEAIANILKGLLRDMAEDIGMTQIVFGQKPSIKKDDVRRILAEAKDFQRTAKRRIEEAPEGEQHFYVDLARDLEQQFCGFDYSEFFPHLECVVNEEIGLLKQTMVVWPTILDAAYELKTSHGLPMKRIR